MSAGAVSRESTPQSSGADTLVSALRDAAEQGTAQLSFHLADGTVRMGIDELVERAGRAARRLLELGVQPGDRVAVLGPNRPEWAVWAFASWFAGATLVPVQIPMRLRAPAAFTEQLRFLVRAGDCRVVMCYPQLLRFVEQDRGVPWSDDELPAIHHDAAPSGDDVAVLQFTSGSTAQPKGALLSHAAVMAQLRGLTTAIGMTQDDGLGVWGPFFHDLGLFGCLLAPIVAGASCHHLPTELFARAPAEWLRLCSDHRASVTVGPCSAWSAALRTVLHRDEKLDLSSLRRCYFAAEGIDFRVVDDLLAASARLRLAPESLGGTYGMAETVLAVTLTPPGGRLRFHGVALDALAATGRADAATGAGVRQLVSSGTPWQGMQVRIVGPHGLVDDRHVGEIHVRGPSMMSGYVGGAGSDPFVDGWLATGDVGFLLDGELYVTGRMRDIVIVLGHNYYPEDFEWAAQRVEGVRPGRAVAFACDGAEAVVVIVEPERAADAAALANRVRAAVGNVVGVTPGEVLVIDRGAVLKTTSGKLRRAAMKEAWAGDDLPVIAVAGRSGAGGGSA